jgi:hypothetical protein
MKRDELGRITELSGEDLRIITYNMLIEAMGRLMYMEHYNGPDEEYTGPGYSAALSEQRGKVTALQEMWETARKFSPPPPDIRYVEPKNSGIDID